MPESYTGRYAIDRLVYFEFFRYVRSAIAREKRLKHCTREEKILLIERKNPTWEDLYPGLVGEAEFRVVKADPPLREG